MTKWEYKTAVVLETEMFDKINDAGITEGRVRFRKIRLLFKRPETRALTA